MLQVLTPDADSARPSPTDFAALACAQLSAGALLLPETDGYEEARGVWNLAYGARPAAIVQAADATTCHRRALRAGGRAEIAVRSGGHSLAGFSTGDGVLVIDLRRLRGLHIDPARASSPPAPA